MRVYLAAQYNQKPEIALKKQDLQALGFVVTSTWTDEPENPQVSLKDITDETLRGYAGRDLEEIDNADLLVLFTVDPDQLTRRGGRHVEYGYAVGKGIPTCLIGPRENIFHHLLPTDLCFPTWTAFLDAARTGLAL
jgi:nucleoside 2-deoxyribosyltransferase